MLTPVNVRGRRNGWHLRHPAKLPGLQILTTWNRWYRATSCTTCPTHSPWYDHRSKRQIKGNAWRRYNCESWRPATHMATSPHCNSAAKRAVHGRLVLDICALSTALVRRRVQIPTADKILRKLEGATVFTKVNLSWIYLSIDARRRIRPLITATDSIVSLSDSSWAHHPREDTSMK